MATFLTKNTQSTGRVVAYGQWIVKWRWPIIILSILAVSLIASGAKNLWFATNYRTFFSKDNPQLNAFETLQNVYTKNDNVMFVLEPEGGDAFNSGTDIGIAGEYLCDERGDDAATPFEDDLFIGVRLALNDIQSTSLLAGTIIDRETGSNSVGVEGNRRLWESWTIDVEVCAIIGTEPMELFHGLRRDNYVQVQLARHF